MKYILLLRGINVGGNATVKMADLKAMLEDMGFDDVKTLLNSGNVVFETKLTSLENLKKSIEKKLEQTFGFSIHAIIRTIDDIQKLVNVDPFKGVSVTKDTRLYVTFLAERDEGQPCSTLKAPYTSPEKDLQILRITDSEICSVITVSTNKDTTDMMGFLEKEFGKKITTRSWNTVLKLLL